eukprot:gene9417-1624_t
MSEQSFLKSFAFGSISSVIPNSLVFYTKQFTVKEIVRTGFIQGSVFAFKDSIKSILPKNNPKENFRKSFVLNFIAGSSASFLTSIISKPLFPHKITVVNEQLKNMKFSEIIKSRYQGFYLQAIPLSIFRGFYFGIYDSFRDYYQFNFKNNFVNSIISSFIIAECSSFTSQFVGNVVSTFYLNFAQNHKNPKTTFKEIAKNEGLTLNIFLFTFQ